MRPDRDTRVLLRELAKERALVDGHSDMTVVREAYDRVFALWSAPVLVPTRENWIDVSIGSGPMPVLCVEPIKKSSPAGTVIFFHGGGWSLGSAVGYAPIARFIAAQSGLRVLVPDYPLAPEHQYPAGHDAARKLIAWTHSKHETPIVLAGDSAGGTLAAVLASHLYTDYIVIAGQALLYPVLDLRPDADYASRRRFGRGNHFLKEGAVKAAAASYCGEMGNPEASELSPILAETFGRLPRTFLLLPDLDPLRDEGETYGRALSQAGVDVELCYAKRTIHGCASFAGMLPEGRKGLMACAHFVASCCAGVS